MDLVVHIPDASMARARAIDLSPFLGRGCDAIVSGISRAATYALKSEQWSPTTANTVLSTVRSTFIPWLSVAATALGRPLLFSDLDLKLLENYVADLKQAKNFTTAAQSFDQIIALLHVTASLGLSRPVAEIRPQNPFPNRAASQVPNKAFTKRERRRLLVAYTDDLSAIRLGALEEFSLCDAVVVYYVLIAFRTGFNSAPLLEIGRDALKDHPLRPGYKILVSFKLRGMREVSVSTKWSEEVEEFRVCGNEVATLYTEVLELTDQLHSEIPEVDRAFVRPPVGLHPKERVGRLPVALTARDVTNAIHKRISPRHNLAGDDGKPLRASGRRMRATLAERAFELSDGDPFVVAKILNNTPKVTNLHYLSPPPDSETNFLEAMNQLVTKLSAPPPNEVFKTPSGSCTDPLNGRYAPKDGVTYCERWLHCFKCPHQCITGDSDELWRLYSFYWMLQRNAQRVRGMPFSGLFRFVVRALETTILDLFGTKARKAMKRARADPHPLWARSRDQDWLDV